MNKIIANNKINIKDMIYKVSDKQVMFDSKGVLPNVIEYYNKEGSIQ